MPKTTAARKRNRHIADLQGLIKSLATKPSPTESDLDWLGYHRQRLEDLRGEVREDANKRLLHKFVRMAKQ